jgi:hypothetical protein
MRRLLPSFGPQHRALRIRPVSSQAAPTRPPQALEQRMRRNQAALGELRVVRGDGR